MCCPVWLGPVKIHQEGVMFELNIDPTMLRFGTLALSWHGFFTAVGLFVGVWVVARLISSYGISSDHVFNATPWAVIAGIIGARLLHVIDQWPFYAANPISILYVSEGGIAIYGGVIFGILGAYLYCRKNKVPVAPFADAGAVGLILGQAIGRIGDIINGEHLGRPVDAPYAVVYTHPDTLGQLGLPVHLAVGYEMVLDLIAFGLLLAFWKKLPVGVLFWIYVVLYSVIRLVVGFFRFDNVVAFGLGQAQIIGLVGIAIGVPLAIWTARRPQPLVVEDDEEEDESTDVSKESVAQEGGAA